MKRIAEQRLNSIIKQSVNNVIKETRLVTEKHRPSGVSKRIHTRDANGKKVSYNYIPNLAKYNKGLQFKQASKFQRVNARPVTDPNGETLDTVLANGTVERRGVQIPKGHYVLNNVGSPEKWGIDPETFAKKYEADPTQKGVYKPKGAPMLASQPMKRNFSIQAPWGGRMDMKAGSRILQDKDNPKDTYGIDGEAFEKTYKFDESRRYNIDRIIRESINKVLKEATPQQMPQMGRTPYTYQYPWKVSQQNANLMQRAVGNGGRTTQAEEYFLANANDKNTYYQIAQTAK